MAKAFFCKSDVKIKGENESVAKATKIISKYFGTLFLKIFLAIKKSGKIKNGSDKLSIIFEVWTMIWSVSDVVKQDAIFTKNAFK